MCQLKAPQRAHCAMRVSSLWYLVARVGRTPLARGVAHVLRNIPGRRHFAPALRCLTRALLVLGAAALLYERFVTAVEKNFYYLNTQNVTWTVPGNACVLPDLDPFDPRWKSYFFNPPPINCERRQPFMSYVDAQGILHLNESGARAWGLKEGTYECKYAAICRVPHDDSNVLFSAPLPISLEEPRQLRDPFVRVQCFSVPQGTLFYETGHAWVPPMPLELAARVQPASPLRPSVLLLGLDSMSRLNFIRQLPKTYDLLSNQWKVIEFRGMVKVGDNTYPNLMAMLAGLDAYGNHRGVTAPVWTQGRDYFFDSLPAVWKNFSSEGFVTMYAEDRAELNTFNFKAKGFDNPPTDYYMRPFWLGMESMTTFRPRDERCFHNFPNYEYLFNHTLEFVTKMREKRFFSFNFLTGFSHTLVNDAKVLDDVLLRLLLDIRSSGVLRNTVLLVFGDHGNRFDAVRTTMVGRVEERMPYLAVALPPDLRDARPYLQEALRANVDTLLSWYDVYETLMDLALDNLGEKTRVPRFGEVGTSLFRRVPSRMCPQAGIPEEHCVCAAEVAISPGSAEAAGAAEALVSHVNALLAAGARGACAPLVLDAVVSAQKLMPSMQVAHYKSFSVTVRVTVRTAPGAALLEGALERHAWGEGRVAGAVARVNAYANQSHCIPNVRLKLYCFCNDLLPDARHAS